MLKKTILAGSLLLAGALAFGPPAHAGYIVYLTQVGSNVVATGSGTIDLTDLTFLFSGTTETGMSPSGRAIITGPAGLTADDVYGGFTGPANFGSGGEALVASSGSGDVVGINYNFLAVPSGYVSGNLLSDSSTYDNQTFASLGVTLGSYVWTWGSGADADSFTLDIGSTAVPEPGSLLLLGTALIGIGAVGFSRRRRA